MLTFPFNTDVKFTVVPVMGGVGIPREEMIDLQVKIENLNRGVSFEPVWSWNDVGIEIEIERDKIKFATTYFVVLSWKKPDTAFNDGYKDYAGIRTCIAFVNTHCEHGTNEVIELVVSPEFKGEKGDPFRFEDFTQEQLDDLQRPAIEAAETANQAATIAITAAGKADTATQSAITATSAANTAAETANQAAANVKDGYTPTVGENENWFVNDVDTGKPSRGRIGETIYNVATGTPLRVWLSDTLPAEQENDIIYIGYE